MNMLGLHMTEHHQIKAFCWSRFDVATVPLPSGPGVMTLRGGGGTGTGTTWFTFTSLRAQTMQLEQTSQIYRVANIGRRLTRHEKTLR